jgi:hypothetical protein
MKCQSTIHRKVLEYPGGQRRWDRAHLFVLEIAHSVEMNQKQADLEVRHASSDLCEGVDSMPSTSSND